MTDDISKGLYVQNVDDWKKDFVKRFSDTELKVNIVERGIILPARKIGGTWKGGVCDSDLNFVSGFSRTKNNSGGGFRTMLSIYPVDRKEIVELDEDVIFGGVLIGRFGHFMIECLSRLWYVLQHPELQLKILFVAEDYKSWFNEFFRLMGLDAERIVYVKQPTQCRSVIVPEQSYYLQHPNQDTNGSFTKEFLAPYQAIKSRITPGTSKKLYLIRSVSELQPKFANSFNERYFQDFFVARGFEAVSIETLSIEEQISLIMGADEIAAIMGTLTHWAIFCKPTAKFTFLMRTHDALSIQSLICEAANIDYYIVDASKNFMYANQFVGVCMLGSNKYWKAFVADYFGEQIDEDDDAPYFNDALENYVNFWCKKYADTDKVASSLKDMCNRIVALEKELHMKRPLLIYQTHVDRFGWSARISENQISNPVNQRRDIQAIKINFSEPFRDVYYAVYFNDREGWSQEVCNGAQAGTTGQRKSITGIKIRLDDSGGGANEFDILYRVHTFDGEWTPWAQNGAEILSQGVKLNAIQITLKAKSAE